jgi:hypothetical protein
MREDDESSLQRLFVAQIICCNRHFSVSCSSSGACKVGEQLGQWQKCAQSCQGFAPFPVLEQAAEKLPFFKPNHPACSMTRPLTSVMYGVLFGADLQV